MSLIGLFFTTIWMGVKVIVGFGLLALGIIVALSLIAVLVLKA